MISPFLVIFFIAYAASQISPLSAQLRDLNKAKEQLGNEGGEEWNAAYMRNTELINDTNEQLIIWIVAISLFVLMGLFAMWKKIRDDNHTLTLSAGTGVTLHGDASITKETCVTFRVVCTNITASSEAVLIYISGN